MVFVSCIVPKLVWNPSVYNTEGIVKEKLCSVEKRHQLRHHLLPMLEK